MKIIDISWPLTGRMTTYKNREDFSVSFTKTWADLGVRESRFVCGSHAGTHIDAPSHFLESGASVDAISLEKLIGPCVVLDVTDVSDAITADHLKKQKITAPRVLLKTRNSQHGIDDPFDSEFVYLSESGALFLSELGIMCVGIDYLGIERNQPGHPTHKILLEAGVVIVEGLRLAHVAADEYTLVCLPIALSLEAAPARAVLMRSFPFNT